MQIDLESLPNRTADSTAVEDLGHNPGDRFLKLEVRDPRGVEIREVKSEIIRMVGFPNNWTNLKPGEVETNTINLDERYDFREPGIHTVEISFGEVRCRYLLILEMPSEVEAERLIQEQLDKTREYNERLKAQASQTTGRQIIFVKSFRRERFFSPEPFRFPPYLPTLLKHFDAFDFQFNPSLRSIGTLESGRALVERLEADPRIANEAAKILATAIPSPEQRSAEPTSPNAPFPVWSDEFKDPMLKWARVNIESDNAELRAIAALTLGNLGKPSDFNLLSQRLQILLEQNEHFTARRECRDLIKYCHRVLKSSSLPSPPLRTLKTLGAKFDAPLALELALPESPTSKGNPVSQEKLGAGVKHPNPFIRTLALQHYLKVYGVRFPMPKVIKSNLTQLMVNSDSELSATACEVAGKSKDPTFLPAILKVVSKAQPGEVLDAVIQAGYGLGANYDIWLALANRLTEEGKWRFLESLAAVAPAFELKTTQHSKLPFSTPHLKENWLAFLKLHEKRLRAGQLIGPDEAKLIADLQPPNKAWFINGEKAIKTEEDLKHEQFLKQMGQGGWEQPVAKGARVGGFVEF